jgi:alpha-D-xyloside xylohydrolase
VNFDRLRYRMMPYIYSLAWMTTSQSYTPMRPLVMDFRTDLRAANVGDQFMYGPAFLVNPVTEPAATTRQVYLPEAKWYDFWTGSELVGGHTINAITPLDRMPLYVRAGSIVPLGPDVEWSTEKAADPIELRIYRGGNGDFTIHDPAALGRCFTNVDHWRSQGAVPWDAGEPDVPCCVRAGEPRRRRERERRGR